MSLLAPSPPSSPTPMGCLVPSVCLVSSPAPRRARCCRPRCWGCCWPRRSAGGLRTMPGNRRWRRWHCGYSNGVPSRWRGSFRTAFTHLGLRRCASNRELKSWKVEELECLVSPTLQLFNSSNCALGKVARAEAPARSGLMQNRAIAAMFNDIADMLEIKGESPFRITAYRRAARALEGLTEDIAAIAARGEYSERDRVVAPHQGAAADRPGPTARPGARRRPAGREGGQAGQRGRQSPAHEGVDRRH